MNNNYGINEQDNVDKIQELDNLDRAILISLNDTSNLNIISGECDMNEDYNRCQSLSICLTDTDRCIMKTVLKNCSNNAKIQLVNASNNNRASCRRPKSICPILCAHPNPDKVNQSDLFNKCFGRSRFSDNNGIKTKLRNTIYRGSKKIDYCNNDCIEEKRGNKKTKKKKNSRQNEIQKMEFTIDFEVITNDMRIGYLFRFGCKKKPNINTDCDSDIYKKLDCSTNSKQDNSENPYYQQQSLSSNRNSSFDNRNEYNDLQNDDECNDDIENNDLNTTTQNGISEEPCIKNNTNSFDDNCICFHCGAVTNLTISKGKILCKVKCSNIKKKSPNTCGDVTTQIVPRLSNSISICESLNNFNNEKSLKSDNQLSDQGILNKYGVANEKFNFTNIMLDCNDRIDAKTKKRQLMNQCKSSCPQTKSHTKSKISKCLRNKINYDDGYSDSDSDEDSIDDIYPKKKSKISENLLCSKNSRNIKGGNKSTNNRTKKCN